MNQTALHEWHSTHDARMVDFAGWEMPIQYTSIVEEHHAVRNSLGLFDISHMGRLWFRGDGALPFLDHILTNHVAKLNIGQVRYSLVCNETGGILDDVLIYRFDDEFLLVVNGANREKIVEWIESHRSGFNFDFEDRTLPTCMIALQGPKAVAAAQPHTDTELSELKYYHVTRGSVFGVDCVISRTGYTGEDGFEFIVSNKDGPKLWSALINGSPAAVACGLGCRDTLRLEAAMPLYGHEMDEQVTPVTAGLMFGVRLSKDAFIGRDAIESAKQAGATRKRIGLQLEGKRIAREGALLMNGDDEVGIVTSGTFSPTLSQSLAMGYVDTALSEPGTALEVDIRGKRHPAKIVNLPFYKRS